MRQFFRGMRGRMRSIFFIAAITAGGILLCQLYWVYFNYKTGRSNFIQTATIALRQSIDSCLLGQSALPSSLAEKNPSLTFMMTQTANVVSQTGDSAAKPSFSVRLFTVPVNEDQLPGVKALVGRLFSMQANKPLNLDTLRYFFQQELLRQGIRQQFTLVMERNRGAVLPGEIAAAASYNKEPVVIKADLSHKTNFFLRMNFIPAFISTLLIALSAGCLFYMGRIIKRQMQLDSMKDDFINNTIHELRTPLTILRTTNEAMGSFGVAQDEASLMRYLGINARVIDDLDMNIERILDFSRAAQGKRLPALATTDLLPILEQAQLRFGQVNDATISLATSERPFEVVTDPFLFTIILSNLVDNAIKYSPDKATVAITVKRAADGWQLTVSDRGIGIPRLALPYIFDRFYRVPTGDLHERKGYGIGLAYVKQLVTDLQGKITVASEPGKGTTFTLTFYNHG